MAERSKDMTAILIAALVTILLVAYVVYRALTDAR